MPGRREQLAREVRARLQQQKTLEWVELPGWVLGEGHPSILVPVGPRGDDVTLAAKTTRAEYLAAVAAAVEAGEFPAWVDPEDSWLRFQLCRDHGEHGVYCSCGPCAQKKSPAPLSTPKASMVETYGQEGGGTQRRSDPTTWREPDRETEQQRLTRIANNAETRWFT